MLIRSMDNYDKFLRKVHKRHSDKNDIRVKWTDPSQQ